MITESRTSESLLAALLDLPEEVELVGWRRDHDAGVWEVDVRVARVPLGCGRAGCSGRMERVERGERLYHAPPIAGVPMRLRLTFWRYRCRCGGGTAPSFAARPELGEPGRTITRSLARLIERHLHRHGFTETARLTGVSREVVRAVFDAYVAHADAVLPPVAPRILGLDEVYLGGRARVTLVELSPSGRRLVDLLPSKDPACLRAYLHRLPGRERIEGIVADCDKSFRKTWIEVLQSETRARLTVDRWHVVQLSAKAVQDLRKRLARQRAPSDRLFDGATTILTARPHTLGPEDRHRLAMWAEAYPLLGRACALHQRFARLFDCADADAAAAHYTAWAAEVRANRQTAAVFRTVLKTVDDRLDEVLGFFTDRLTAGYTEAINGEVRRLYGEGRGWAEHGFPVVRALALLRFGAWTAEALQAHPRPEPAARKVVFGDETETYPPRRERARPG